MMPGAPRSTAHARPETLPIFPLAGVLLLPRGQLPLNVFEPRYLAMTRDAMLGDRLIGMVQPIDPGEDGEGAPAVYTTGCAGRITSFQTTDDGRCLITLTGVTRFDIVDELPLTDTGYRRVRVAYDGYAGDMGEPDEDAIDRARLVRALKACLPTDGESVLDWDSIDGMTNDALVTTLAMAFPFAPSEKQALLEAPGAGEIARILTMLMDITAATFEDGAGARLQ